MTLYRVLADVVVVVHAGYVAFVILAQLLILVGYVRGWAWIRNMTFRLVHLAAILVVVLEAWWGMTCPLTDWERQLRTLGGETAYPGDFIGRFAHDVLFYNGPPWVFTVCYTAFGALVLLTFLLAPPRRRQRQGGEPRGGAAVRV